MCRAKLRIYTCHGDYSIHKAPSFLRLRLAIPGVIVPQGNNEPRATRRQGSWAGTQRLRRDSRAGALNSNPGTETIEGILCECIKGRTMAGNMTLFRKTIKLHVIVFIVRHPSNHSTLLFPGSQSRDRRQATLPRPEGGEYC